MGVPTGGWVPLDLRTGPGGKADGEEGLDVYVLAAGRVIRSSCLSRQFEEAWARELGSLYIS